MNRGSNDQNLAIRCSESGYRSYIKSEHLKTAL